MGNSGRFILPKNPEWMGIHKSSKIDDDSNEVDILKRKIKSKYIRHLIIVIRG